MRQINVNVNRYADSLKKYLREDMQDMFGVILPEDAINTAEYDELMSKATDEVLADDIVDGAARWYAYKHVVKIAMEIGAVK